MVTGSVRNFLMMNSEGIQNGNGAVLHDDFIEQHSAAPGAAAGSQFSFEDCHFDAGFRQVARRHECGGTAADNGNVQNERLFEFCAETAHDCG